MNLLAFDIRDYFDDSDSFSTKDGLSIAFTSSDELDPAYASIVPSILEWGYDQETGEDFERNDVLSVHPCTFAELGLEEDNSQSSFFDIKPSREQELKQYAPLF